MIFNIIYFLSIIEIRVIQIRSKTFFFRENTGAFGFLAGLLF